VDISSHIVPIQACKVLPAIVVSILLVAAQLFVAANLFGPKSLWLLERMR